MGWGSSRVRQRIWAVAATASLFAVTVVIGGAKADTVAPPLGVGAQSADCPNGVPSHAPIVINTDADWAPYKTANGTYQIACVSINGTDPNTGAAISIAPTDLSYEIADVELSGLSSVSAGSGIVLPGSTTGTATIKNATIMGYAVGVLGNGPGVVEIDDNFISGAAQSGVSATAGGVTTSGNFIDGHGFSACESIGAASTSAVVKVKGDTCVGWHEGFFIGGASPSLLADVSDSKAEGASGPGFDLTDVRATGNTADGDGTGFALTDFNVLSGNVADHSAGAGIDLATSDYGQITNNTITNFGVAGITGNPAYSGGPAFTFDNEIWGNHIAADNHAGIVFLGLNSGNEVWGTDWLGGGGGSATINDPGGLNTVVDAGATKSQAAGQAVAFDDYVDRVTIGHAAQGSAAITDPLLQAFNGATGINVGIGGVNISEQPAAVVSVNWDFGDGQSTCLVDATQGHGPPPVVSHAYGGSGSYIATLTVSVVNPSATASPCGASGVPSSGQPPFTDTVTVTIN